MTEGRNFMLSVTIDTNALINWMDRKGSYQYVNQIARWHEEGYIKLFASSRVCHPDAQRMFKKQRNKLEQWLTQHKIQIAESTWRVGISPVGGPDVLGGPQQLQSQAEFEKIVGPDPAPEEISLAELQRRWGNMKDETLKRKIGDYDALRDHFAAKRDVFITSDTKDIFCRDKRTRYKEKLGLVIQSPKEFVEEHSEQFTESQCAPTPSTT